MTRENASLVSAAAAAKANEPKLGDPQTADELQQLFHAQVHNGMTLAEVTSVLGKPSDSSKAGDVMTYTFKKQTDVDGGSAYVTQSVFCTFGLDGKLATSNEQREKRRYQMQSKGSFGGPGL